MVLGNHASSPLRLPRRRQVRPVARQRPLLLDAHVGGEAIVAPQEPLEVAHRIAQDAYLGGVRRIAIVVGDGGGGPTAMGLATGLGGCRTVGFVSWWGG